MNEERRPVGELCLVVAFWVVASIAGLVLWAGFVRLLVWLVPGL